MSDPNARLRQWLIISLGHLWQNNEKARWSGARDLAHEKLYKALTDPVPEVRAAAVYALGTFISSVQKDRTEQANIVDRFIAMTLLNTLSNDMSPLVRMELVAALQWIILSFESQFVSLVLQEQSSPNVLPHNSHSLERKLNMKRVSSSSSLSANTLTGSLINFTSSSSTKIGFGSNYMKIYQGLLTLSRDAHPGVSALAQKVIDYILNKAEMISVKEATKENCSLSLPPSPNTRTNYLMEPPTQYLTKASLLKQISPQSKVSTQIESNRKPNSTSAASSFDSPKKSDSKEPQPQQLDDAKQADQLQSNDFAQQNGQQRPRRNSKANNKPRKAPVFTVDIKPGTDEKPNNASPLTQIPVADEAVASPSSTRNEKLISQSKLIQQSPPLSTQQQQQSQQQKQTTQPKEPQPISLQPPIKPLVQTDFIKWVISSMSSPSSSLTNVVDKHLPKYLEKMQRFERNKAVRIRATGDTIFC